MKETRYFPFERNRYFYGKLLTVRDFESEQKYFNDKRRLLNRLLYGVGVVSGLQVVRVDDKSVSVEAGAALDSYGREIVVASPVTLKLSMVDGFMNNEYAKNVYLCIQYDEKGKEPVHSVASSSLRSEEVSEYNRVLENYRLFVREEAPDLSRFDHMNLLEQIAVLYQDSQVRILQKTPHYVNPEGLFEVTLRVEKTLQTAKIDLEYELDAEHFTRVDSRGSNKIVFSEPGAGQETDYEVRYLFRATGPAGTKGKLAIKRGSGKLTVGDRQTVVDPMTANAVEIIYGPVKERILQDYFDRSFDQAIAASSDDCIYLAKISLMQMGPTYMIEKVHKLPFDEYVPNHSLLFKLGLSGQEGAAAASFLAKSSLLELSPDEKPHFQVEYNRDNHEFDFRLGLPAPPRRVGEEATSGIAEIPVEPVPKSALKTFAKAQKSFFTDEIRHGLGEGPVYIMAGLAEQEKGQLSDLLGRDESVYLGDPDVFRDSPYEPGLGKVSIGVVTYPKKGTFRIGIKVQNAAEPRTVRIHWWAFMKHPSAAGGSIAGDDDDGGMSDLEAAAGREP